MTTINLKRYYPYMTENVMLEVSDEIAAALSMGGRLCDSYKRQKRRNGECSLDTDPGFEADVLRQPMTPDEYIEARETTFALYDALTQLPPTQARRVYQHYLLGMSKAEIAAAEGVGRSRICCSMVKKLSEFQTLTAKRETVNPKLTALNMELARVEEEIEKLLNTLTGANAVLLSYANSKIEELDTRRQTLTKEIAALSAEAMSPEQIERLSVYLNQWEEIDFEDRRQVADGLISQIRATDEHVSIEWKI